MPHRNERLARYKENSNSSLSNTLLEFEAHLDRVAKELSKADKEKDNDFLDFINKKCEKGNY